MEWYILQHRPDNYTNFMDFDAPTPISEAAYQVKVAQMLQAHAADPTTEFRIIIRVEREMITLRTRSAT